MIETEGTKDIPGDRDKSWADVLRNSRPQHLPLRKNVKVGHVVVKGAHGTTTPWAEP